MPFLDRFWWLRMLFALYVLAAAIVIPYWAFTQPYDLFRNGCINCLFGAELLGGISFVVWLAVDGLRARERKMRRLRAIRGDLDAVPLARMASDIARRWFIAVLNARADMLEGPLAEGSAQKAKPSDTFLTLQWRWSTLWQDASGDSYPRWRAIGLLALPFATCSLISFTAGLVAVYSATQIDLSKFIWAEIPSLWIWPFIIFTTWRPNPQSVFLIPFHRSPFGIITNEEGIEERTRFGDWRFVRWDDARLLEVRLVKGEYVEIGYQYILYSQQDAVQWYVDFLSPREYLVPDGMRRDEMESRSRQLLYLIVARTGLLPRTFDRKLQAAP